MWCFRPECGTPQHLGVAGRYWRALRGIIPGRKGGHAVDDTELFAKLLRIAPPWRVTRVSVHVAAERVEVWVEEIPGAQFPWAGCRAARAGVRSPAGPGVAAPGPR